MHRKQTIFLSMMLLIISIASNGQKLINAPYSRFNLGSLEPQGSFRTQAMGGTSAAMRSNNSISFANPASYSAFDTMSFQFDFGIDYGLSRLTEGSALYKTDDLNFDHLIMGIPISKGLGFAVGVLPYSNGYYKIIDQVTSTDANYNPAVGAYTITHNGEGGITKIFLGTGLKFAKYFSAGVNMTILTGSLNRTNNVNFDETYYVYHNSSIEKTSISGVNLEYGLQFHMPVNTKNFLTAGLAYIPGRHYKTSYEEYLYKFTVYGTTDTISYTNTNSRSLYIPGTFRAGISFGKTNKYTAALDYVQTSWSKAAIPGSSGYIADTKAFLFGLEYTPDKYSNFSLFQRIDYRLGAHFGSNYLVLDGTQVKESGVSIGFGIPMRKSISKTNLFFDYTRRNGPIVDKTLSMGISLNLYDNYWFRKAKYE